MQLAKHRLVVPCEITQIPESEAHGNLGDTAPRVRRFNLDSADNARGKGTLLYNSPKVQAFGSYLAQDAPFDRDRRSFTGSGTLQPLDEDFTNLFLKVNPAQGLTLMLDYQRNETPYLFIPSTQDAFVEESPLTLAASYESGDLEQGRIEAKLHYTRDDAEEYEIEQQTGRLAYREYQNATTAGATLTGFKRLFDDHVFTLGASWQREQAENMDFDRYIQFRERFLGSQMHGTQRTGALGPCRVETRPLISTPVHNAGTGLRSLAICRWLAALATLVLAPTISAYQESARTQEVKAAFILNIARFVEWPAAAYADRGNMQLCLYRSNSLGRAIDSIREKKVKGRTLLITTVRSLGEASHCNILFVPPQELESFDRDAQRSPVTALLTITDRTKASHAEHTLSHIQVSLIRDGARIGIEVNMRVVNRSGLRMSSELLKLGRIVGNES